MYMCIYTEEHISITTIDEKDVCAHLSMQEKKKKAVHFLSQQYKIRWLSHWLYDLRYQILDTYLRHSKMKEHPSPSLIVHNPTVTLTGCCASPKGRKPFLQAAGNTQQNDQSHSLVLTQSFQQVFPPVLNSIPS